MSACKAADFKPQSNMTKANSFVFASLTRSFIFSFVHSLFSVKSGSKNRCKEKKKASKCKQHKCGCKKRTKKQSTGKMARQFTRANHLSLWSVVLAGTRRLFCLELVLSFYGTPPVVVTTEANKEEKRTRQPATVQDKSCGQRHQNHCRQVHQTSE